MSTDEDRTTIGAKLKRAREYCGYSQEEVARALDISRSAVSLMESGARGVEALELRKLARLYECSIDELAGSELPQRDQATIDVVARATSELTEADRKEVLQFAQFLKSRRRREQEHE